MQKMWAEVPKGATKEWIKSVHTQETRQTYVETNNQRWRYRRRRIWYTRNSKKGKVHKRILDISPEEKET